MRQPRRARGTPPARIERRKSEPEYLRLGVVGERRLEHSSGENVTEPCLLIESPHPAVARLTLNRPAKRNALSIELIEQLRDAVRSAADEVGRRVLIIAAAGPAFCAGLDLSEAADPALADRSAHLLVEMYEAIANSPLATIAAARGAAMGGGAGIIAACDFAVVADDFRLSYPEVHRGLVAALVTCLLRRQITDRSVRELVLLGQTVNAQESLQRGLVTKVVAGEQLDHQTGEIACQVCKGAPGAIARTKRLLDDLSGRPITAELQIALRYHLEARNSAEATEGIKAFLEKRAPQWPTVGV
jgi:methylglutaconyl-CoA hydratase